VEKYVRAGQATGGDATNVVQERCVYHAV